MLLLRYSLTHTLRRNALIIEVWIIMVFQCIDKFVFWNNFYNYMFYVAKKSL